MIKRILKYTIGAVVLLLLFIFITDYWVARTVEQQLFDDIEQVGHHKVGLLLGTSKYVSTGNVNLYYKYRIAAAVRLYHAGKIDFVLVSGDNRHKTYNEPETMKQDLIDAGIPANKIFLDYAGFRTLDSVVRCEAIFGQKDFIIISQKFHNERAVFIANSKGLKAVGFNALNPPTHLTIKVSIREKLARVKMLIDLLTNKQPHFYGETIEIKDTIINNINNFDIE